MPHRGPNFRDTQVNTSQQAKPKMRRNYVQTATEHAIRSTKHRYVPHVHRCTCQVLRALKENVGGIRTGGKTKSSHYFSGCSAGPGTVHTGLEAQNKSLGAAMQAWDTAGRRSHPLAHIPSDHRRQVASAAPTAPSLAQATEGHASQPPGEGGSDARRVPPRALAGHEECTVSTSPAGTKQCMVRSSHKPICGRAPGQPARCQVTRARAPLMHGQRPGPPHLGGNLLPAPATSVACTPIPCPGERNPFRGSWPACAAQKHHGRARRSWHGQRDSHHQSGTGRRRTGVATGTTSLQRAEPPSLARPAAGLPAQEQRRAAQGRLTGAGCRRRRSAR